MTPEEFFDNIISGAENMLVPVILLVVTLCFSSSIAELGLIEWLAGAMAAFSGGNYWLLPALMFFLFTVIGMLLGESWSMYIFALPIAIQLSMAVGGNTALCVGAVCAVGIAGDGLSYYQSDNLFIAAVIGCEPTALVNARFPYFAFITFLASALYLVAGIML
jgi:Na+/H+ antiporter NhaC